LKILENYKKMDICYHKKEYSKFFNIFFSALNIWLAEFFKNRASFLN